MYFQYFTESNAKEETIHSSICVRFLQGKKLQDLSREYKSEKMEVYKENWLKNFSISI
jgi:hypothetical protein